MTNLQHHTKGATMSSEFGHQQGPDQPSYDEVVAQHAERGQDPPFTADQYEAMRAATAELYLGPRTRLCTSAILADIVEAARAREYNRQLDDRTVRRLDPDGTHLMSALLIHRHAQGQPVSPHIRVTTHLKLAGTMEPFETVLDIPFEIFEALPTPKMAKLTLGLREALSDG